MNVTIGCRYSCPECGIDDVEVQVPARDQENVVEWLEKVCIPTVGADHARRSPGCTPKGLKNLKIPMTGVDRVGGAPVN